MVVGMTDSAHFDPSQTSDGLPEPSGSINQAAQAIEVEPEQSGVDRSVPALALRGLSKNFGTQVAVDAIDLDVPRGSFFGVVGPNGAGKTTALSMATGLLRPDAGQAWVCGYEVWLDAKHANIEAKRRYGLLADNLPVFDQLTAREHLNYVGLLRGMDPEVVTQRADSLLDALELADTKGKYISDFSAGMTKKILLAGALLHRPELLILDEPFEAVDPVSADVIRAILHRYVDAGGTVVMSSHVMELVEGICDHVAIINKGVVAATGTLDEVRAGHSLQERFVELVGGRDISGTDLGWLG